MYTHGRSETVFAELGALGEFGAEGETSTAGGLASEEYVLPAGVVLRFRPRVGAVFTVETPGGARYDYVADKSCTPSTVFVHAANDLYLELIEPVSVGYTTDGRLVISSEAINGNISARGIVQSDFVVGLDMVCNIRAEVAEQAMIYVHSGASIEYYSVPVGISVPSTTRPPVVTVTPLEPCLPGYARNADSECVAMAVPVCGAGQVLDPATNQCVAVPVAVAKLVPWYRRPATYVVGGLGLLAVGLVAFGRRRR